MKTALITGASMGIGRSLAYEFADNGWGVALVARSEGKLREIADDIAESRGVQTTVIPMDLAVDDAPKRLYERVTAEEGLRVEALVNNVGVGANGSFLETDLDFEKTSIQLNVTTMTELTKRFLPDLCERPKGYVLNVASVAGFQPGPKMSVYAATKAYAVSFSEAIYEEMKGTSVSVTALCPGPVATPFIERAEMEDANLFRGVVQDPDDVAAEGYRGMVAEKPVIVPGFLFRTMTKLFGLTVPRPAARKITHWLNSAD